MSIDKGPDSVQRFMEAGYVKTTASGFIFTREGLNFIISSLEELYHLHDNAHPSHGSESGEGDTV